MKQNDNRYVIDTQISIKKEKEDHKKKTKEDLISVITSLLKKIEYLEQLI